MSPWLGRWRFRLKLVTQTQNLRRLWWFVINSSINSSSAASLLSDWSRGGRHETTPLQVSEQTSFTVTRREQMAPGSRSSLAGPLHISYPIKALPAHAFQLQEIYCPEAGLIQQDAADTGGAGRRRTATRTEYDKWTEGQYGAADGRETRKISRRGSVAHYFITWRSWSSTIW